nr:PREDICTED: wee1-like protein kinase 2 [Bemisia tabaci]
MMEDDVLLTPPSISKLQHRNSNILSPMSPRITDSPMDGWRIRPHKLFQDEEENVEISQGNHLDSSGVKVNLFSDKSMDHSHCPSVIIDCDGNEEDDTAGRITPPTHKASLDLFSPPYKRVKHLKLFDSSTPNMNSTPSKYHPSYLRPVDRICSRLQVSGVKSLNGSFTNVTPLHTSRSKPIGEATPVTVNPFTPEGMVQSSLRRERMKSFNVSNVGLTSDTSVKMDEEPLASPICDKLSNSLIQLETSRYHEEFSEECLIGSGDFGEVFKCINLIDGMEYAVKRTNKPVSGTTQERLARREVFAHAAIGRNPYIVAYFSSWCELGHVYLQTEYCNGGNLEQLIADTTHKFTENGLNRILLHVSKGLKHIHSKKLAHLDIKPANILICRNSNANVSSDSFEDIDDDEVDNLSVVYKIGDLGHVAELEDPIDVEDGDCRYLPREILHNKYNNLAKADIFALGLTLYEAGGGGPLPKNGPQWHNLRDNKLPPLPSYSLDFNKLLKSMTDSDPEKRPDTTSLLKLFPNAADLRSELTSWKMKSEFYAQRMKNTTKCITSLHKKQPYDEMDPSSFMKTRSKAGHTRMVGKKSKRSYSVPDM